MTNQLQSNENYLTNPQDYFCSFDLGCCAALLSIGYELETLNKDNPRKVAFILKRANGIDIAINNYWSSDLKVDARTYFDNIKMLKNRIYSD